MTRHEWCLFALLPLLLAAAPSPTATPRPTHAPRFPRVRAPAEKLETVTVEAGKSTTVTVDLEIGEGANSAPDVVEVERDPPKHTLTFRGIRAGRARYTVMETGGSLENRSWDVRVTKPR